MNEVVFIATEDDGSEWVMLQDYQKIQQDYLLSDLAIQDLMKQVSVLLQENIQAKKLIDTIYEIISIECRDVGEAHDGIQKDIEEFRRGLTPRALDGGQSPKI